MLAHTTLGFPGSLIVIINGVNLLLGIFVLLKNPRSIVHRAFFLFILGCSAWGVGIALLYQLHDFVFDKLTLGGGLLMLFGITVFARVFPAESKVSAKFCLIFIPLFIASICLPFNLFIQGITVDKAGFVQPINGPLFPFFAGVTLFYISITVNFFRRSFQKSQGTARMQMLYFITGICIFMLSVLVFDAILPLLGVYELNLLGPLASIIFVLMTSYAIVRHQLMDIRVIIQRGLIYSILFSMVIGTYAFLLFLTESFFDKQEEIVTPLFSGILLLVGILTMPNIERYFRRMTNQFFFRDYYDYPTALQALSTVLNDNIQFTKMATDALDTINSILHPASLTFSHVATNSSFQLFAERADSVFMPNEEDLSRKIVVPVTARGRIIGTFTFGPKLSGDLYSEEDSKLLRTFAEQAAVAFEKAELYQELQDYSKVLEIQVEARTKKLEQMQEDQRQLFDDISHALQTPLTVLKGSIELLRDEPPTNAASTFESMTRGTDDLSRLIREILQLAKMDALPANDEMTKIELSEVVSNIVEYVEVICRQNHIHIRAEVEPEIYILGNKKQIEEMLTNLLSNAVKYTTNSIQKEILVTLRISKGKGVPMVELVVTDTGIGISPERLPYIFDRFYRAHESSGTRTTGYGLGLAIVKRIAERHSASIDVESVPDKGTSMIIRFPQNIDS